MSSFGSSLINKSGKKIAPKASGRRRPGAAPPGAGAASTSARSSAEPSRTPQPESINSQSTALQSSATSNVLQVDKTTGLSAINATPTQTTVPSRVSTGNEDGIPVVQAAASAGASWQTEETTLNPPSISVASIDDTGVPTIISSSSSTRQRDPYPFAHASGPSKRRRLDTDNPPAISLSVVRSETIRQTNSSATPTASSGIDIDEIPVIVTSKRPPPKSQTATSKASRPSSSSRDEQEQTQADDAGLVPYEVPGESREERPTSSAGPRRKSNPTIAPLLTATLTGAKPRPKGSRRQQWQVTTQADLSPAGPKQPVEAPQPQIDEEEVEDEDPIAVVGPKPRKPRKDKGQKKGPRPEQATQEERGANTPDVDREQDGPDTTAGAESTTTQSTPADVSAAEPVHITTPVVEPAQEKVAAAPPQPQPKVSNRLKNLQKRRAKDRALSSAISRNNAREDAQVIDAVVAQSQGLSQQSLSQLLPGAASSSANPLFRVQAQEPSRSRRSSTAATESSIATAMTEGGTAIRRRSHKRAATPEENEQVFISPGATKMLNLVGRDTENRVGMKSKREKEMRAIDWKEVKSRQKEEERKAALNKGAKRDMLSAQVPGATEKASGAGEDGDEADLDEDERLERALARNAGTQPGLRLRMDASGQHMIEESSTFVDVGEVIDEEQDNLVTIEDHDLTSKFNVQTYVKWKRKVPEERVYTAKRWTEEDTERFYDALQCCGADFGSMLSWFPGRLRKSLKRKFNIEERADPQRVDETLRKHLMNRNASTGTNEQTWDMEQFGLDQDKLMDPRKLEEELRVLHVEAMKEIEEERAKTAEVKYQKKRGGFSDSEEESEEEEEDSMDIVAKAREDARRKKAEREQAEAEAGGEDGDEDEEMEEVLETVEGQDTEVGADDEVEEEDVSDDE